MAIAAPAVMGPVASAQATPIITDFAGTGTAAAPVPGLATGSPLNDPLGVAVDGAGNVYIADTRNNVIEKVTADGNLSIVVADGNFYIADYGNADVEKVTPSGTLSIIKGLGSDAAPTYGGVAVDSAEMYASAVAVNADGTVYVGDTYNSTIDRIGFTTPGKPSQPALTAGDRSAHLSFTAPVDGTSAITGYQVSLDGGDTWQPITTSPGANGNLSATLTGLTDGTTYTVLVRATNSSGNGANSPSVSARAEAVPEGARRGGPGGRLRRGARGG